MKLKEVLNYKFNKCNFQKSFDVRQKVLKKNNLDIDDILNLEIKKNKKLKW